MLFRSLTRDQANALLTMARLVHAGLPVETAARIAQGGRSNHQLADGVYLILIDPEPGCTCPHTATTIREVQSGCPVHHDDDNPAAAPDTDAKTAGGLT